MLTHTTSVLQKTRYGRAVSRLPPQSVRQSEFSYASLVASSHLLSLFIHDTERTPARAPETAGRITTRRAVNAGLGQPRAER